MSSERVMTSSTSDSTSRFANYDIIGTIGRGAMGVVYLAKDRRIGRRVALKAVHYDAGAFDESDDAREFYDRLRREAELSGMLQHPNIVTLYEAGVEGDAVTFLAFEYIEGQSLRQIIRAGTLAVETALSYGEGILKGLAYAHSRGVIHRDIKPGNILVNAEGEAKLADFGIARPQESTLTVAGTLVGTPSYMSPEQVAGQQVSPASDLFSFGAVLYEMLTGAKPFNATDVNAVLYNVVHRDVLAPSSLRPELDARFDAYVAKLLAKSPAGRFATAEDALEDLRALRETFSEISGRPDTTVRHRSLFSIRVRPAAAVAIVAAVLLPLVVFGWGAVREAGRGKSDAGTTQMMDALRAKRSALARAGELVANGKLDEGIAAYEDYLRQYPDSAVARERLAEAQRLAEEQRLAEKQRLAAAESKTPRAVVSQPQQAPEKSPGAAKRGWNQLRRKVKKIFD